MQPAINRIPGDSLYSSNRGLVWSLDAERGDLIKSFAPLLESIVGHAGIGTECLTASATTLSTTPPSLGFVKSVANDVSGSAFARQWAFLVWATETLHGFGTVSIAELIAWN